MKNKKIYVVYLISSLILSIVACDKNKKKAPDEQNTTVVCSEIKNEADCNSKNCEWNEDSSICQDKVVETNNEGNSTEDESEALSEESTGTNNNASGTSTEEEKSEEVVNKPADNNDSDSSKEEEKSEEVANNNDSETSKEEEKPVVKPEEVAKFNPKECSDFTGDNLEKCGMINLTETPKNRIICNIVNNIDTKTKKVVSSACKQVTKCEDIKVPAKSTKDKTPNPESLEGKRCAAQGCFVRTSFKNKDTCHTNK